MNVNECCRCVVPVYCVLRIQLFYVTGLKLSVVASISKSLLVVLHCNTRQGLFDEFGDERRHTPSLIKDVLGNSDALICMSSQLCHQVHMVCCSQLGNKFKCNFDLIPRFIETIQKGSLQQPYKICDMNIFPRPVLLFHTVHHNFILVFLWCQRFGSLLLCFCLKCTIKVLARHLKQQHGASICFYERSYFYVKGRNKGS